MKMYENQHSQVKRGQDTRKDWVVLSSVSLVPNNLKNHENRIKEKNIIIIERIVIVVVVSIIIVVVVVVVASSTSFS